MKYLLLLCLLPGMALADLKWDIYYTPGDKIISQAELDKSLVIVQDFYRQKFGINLALASFRAVPYPVGAYSNTLTAFYQFTAIDWWVGRLRNLLRQTRIATLIHPPIYDAGVYYSAGLAWTRSIGSANRPTLAITWCKDKARDCALVLAHEIGHILGALHRDVEPNYMHPQASKWLNEEWQVSYFTTTQIRRRLKRVGLWEKALSFF